ncbi:YIP1 family protein [Desulfonatronospira sp.]|uniref:YIP1 family protein n=1 Tax=Desulfonatronospira sp. TaxID=1962951 RepID=UPI0025BC5EEB|nr:YIP1 family protein [Desulfonatronospira sp.]
MRITCPKCMFQQDVPDDKIPEHAFRATCPKCKEKFQFRDLEEPQEFTLEDDFREDFGDSTEQDKGDSKPHREKSSREENNEESLWSKLEDLGGPREEPQREQAVQEESSASPWENLQQYGFFPGFFETVKRVMLAPGPFFRKMQPGGLGMPLGFFVLVSVIQVLATFLWNMTGMFPAAAEHGAPGMGIGMVGAGSALILLVYPLFMAAWLFIVSGVTHLFLMAFQAGRSGFEGTFRATAYGSAPMLLGVLPILGPFIGAVWSLVVTVMGYRYIHGTSYTRVILALIAPVMIVVLLATMMMGP